MWAVLTKLRPNVKTKVLFLPSVCSEPCTNHTSAMKTHNSVSNHSDVSSAERLLFVPAAYETRLDSVDPNKTHRFRMSTVHLCFCLSFLSLGCVRVHGVPPSLTDRECERGGARSRWMIRALWPQ